MTTTIYVMWSPAKQLSKIGISSAPHARASQVRKSRADDSIYLATCWDIVSAGMLGGDYGLELSLHATLRQAGLQDPSNDFPSEWFTLPWPAAAELVEQYSQLWAPCGVRLRRMPGCHGR